MLFIGAEHFEYINEWDIKQKRKYAFWDKRKTSRKHLATIN